MRSWFTLNVATLSSSEAFDSCSFYLEDMNSSKKNDLFCFLVMALNKTWAVLNAVLSWSLYSSGFRVAGPCHEEIRLHWRLEPGSPLHPRAKAPPWSRTARLSADCLTGKAPTAADLRYSRTVNICEPALTCVSLIRALPELLNTSRNVTGCPPSETWTWALGVQGPRQWRLLLSLPALWICDQSGRDFCNVLLRWKFSWNMFRWM